MTTILTNRELFLLMICTVFYITLFILVIQNNRRKIQLLQSRLDNIHAMQKMAVMEQRVQDKSTSDGLAHLPAPEAVSERGAQHDGERLDGTDRGR